MRATKRQLRSVIRENEATPNRLKVGDLVRSVDFRGDGWGGDYKRVVGTEIGTIVDIDDSEDWPIQYVVNWPIGEPTIVHPDELELINERTMKVTKRQLRRIIREERQRILRELHDPLDPHAGGRPLSKGVQEIFAEVGLTPKETAETREELEEGWSGEWYNSSGYEKLFWHFHDSGEMPYGVAKARTGDPDRWILDYLESLA